jgi:hypothetical protein
MRIFSQANQVQSDIGIHEVYLIIHIKNKHQELNPYNHNKSPLTDNRKLLNPKFKCTKDS